MVKDLGTILVGEMAVKEGLIHEVGGISEALFWLHQEIERRRKRRNYKINKIKTVLFILRTHLFSSGICDMMIEVSNLEYKGVIYGK